MRKQLKRRIGPYLFMHATNFFCFEDAKNQTLASFIKNITTVNATSSLYYKTFTAVIYGFL
jgi:hypothetical protein